MTHHLKFCYHWRRLMTSCSLLFLIGVLFQLGAKARRNRINPILRRPRMRSEMTSISEDADYLSGALVLAITLSQGMQLQNTLDEKLFFFFATASEKTLRQRTVGIHGVAGNYPWPSWRQS